MKRTSLKRREENFWSSLLQQIKNGHCVPFLGSGVAAGVLPTGKELARIWAEEFSFPRKECVTLDQVAQFIEIKYGRQHLEKLVRKRFRIEKLVRERFRIAQNMGETYSTFADIEPYSTFAELPFKLYLTTNYDDLLGNALFWYGTSETFRIVFPRDVRGQTMMVTQQDYFSYYFPEGTRRKLLVEPFSDDRICFEYDTIILHLHGHIAVKGSLVITETDYYESLAGLVLGTLRLPIDFQYILAKSTLLFIGYSLSDWNFRLLFHGLHKRLGRIHHAVVFLPEGTENDRSYAEAYLNQFTRAEVYFGTAVEFATELRRRIQANEN